MHIDSAPMLTQDESGIGRGTARCGTEVQEAFMALSNNFSGGQGSGWDGEARGYPSDVGR